MGDNHRGKLSAVQAQPTNIAAKLTITAFTDRPPVMECNANPVGALRLLAIGLSVVADAIERANLPTNVQADPVDKKREYLGPRK